MSDIYQQLLNSADSHSTYKLGDKVVLEVRFTGGGKTYCYTADSGIYRPGETMRVYVDGSYKPVTIVRVHYFYPQDYPFNLTRIKKAVRNPSKGRSKPKATTKRKELKPERALPDWLLEEDEDELPVIKQSRTYEQKAPVTSQTETVSSSKATYSSSYGLSQSKSKTWLVILAIIAVIGLMQGPTWYRNYINSKPLDTSEIYGGWSDDVYFNSDNTFSFSGDEFLSGKWEVQSRDKNTIVLRYYVTDDQVDMYNQEFQYDMDGYIADREDVLEWETEALWGEIPPEGTYKFIRTENRLEYLDDSDCYLSKGESNDEALERIIEN